MQLRILNVTQCIVTQTETPPLPERLVAKQRLKSTMKATSASKACSHEPAHHHTCFQHRSEAVLPSLWRWARTASSAPPAPSDETRPPGKHAAKNNSRPGDGAPPLCQGGSPRATASAFGMTRRALSTTPLGAETRHPGASRSFVVALGLSLSHFLRDIQLLLCRRTNARRRCG